MRNMFSLLVVAAIALLAYKFYFSQLQTGASGPSSAVTTVGVKNDLLAIAQAERTYESQHGAYGSIENLIEGSALTPDGRKRDGYIYEVEITTGGFRVTARCLASGCKEYFVDQTMEVQPVP